jgi:hypothetical protein
MSDVAMEKHRLTQCFGGIPRSHRLLGMANASVLLGAVPIILDTATVGAAFDVGIFD